VARSIVRESARTGGGVFLTLAHLTANVRGRFPTIAAACRQVGLDLAKDPIPVGPAAHYVMGGIDTDEWGCTSLPGLYAAGETACTGVHGANRLASNSLLEGLVFGARAAVAMQQDVRAAAMKSDRLGARDSGHGTQTQVEPAASGPAPRAASPEEIRDLMWRCAGLFRTRAQLADAVARLEGAYQTAARRAAAAAPASADACRVLNLTLVARLIARAALRREESRGAHYREDFPARDDLHWKVHLTDQRDTYGQE
jgi:L-aspartate oxidase